MIEPTIQESPPQGDTAHRIPPAPIFAPAKDGAIRNVFSSRIEDAQAIMQADALPAHVVRNIYINALSECLYNHEFKGVPLQGEGFEATKKALLAFEYRDRVALMHDLHTALQDNSKRELAKLLQEDPEIGDILTLVSPDSDGLRERIASKELGPMEIRLPNSPIAITLTLTNTAHEQMVLQNLSLLNKNNNNKVPVVPENVQVIVGKRFAVDKSQGIITVDNLNSWAGIVALLHELGHVQIPQSHAVSVSSAKEKMMNRIDAHNEKLEPLLEKFSLLFPNVSKEELVTAYTNEDAVALLEEEGMASSIALHALQQASEYLEWQGFSDVLLKALPYNSSHYKTYQVGLVKLLGKSPKERSIQSLDSPTYAMPNFLEEENLILMCPMTT